jgi:DNA-binding Lrp family transcriptional regulator
MNLTQNEQKLLARLYHSEREPITQLAKETGLTRIQVEYAMKKFEKEGIIKNYLTFVNYKALGYNSYALLMAKCQAPSKVPELKKELTQSKYCISWGESFGEFDIFANIIAKDEQDLSNFIEKIISNEKTQITNYILVKPYLTEFQSLKQFGQTKKLPFIIENSNPVKLDKKELQMLKLLENNARMKIIDLARELDISAELALQKLRKLQKHIITGTRTQLDMKKIGYDYSGFTIYINQLDSETKNKILNFARINPLVNTIVLAITQPNCFIQIFHKTEKELKDTIKEINNLLKEKQFTLHVHLYNEEETVNTLPFL